MSPRGMLSKGRSHPLERWGFLILCLGQLAFFGLLITAGARQRHVEDPRILFELAGGLSASMAGTFMVLHGRRRGAVQVMARSGRVCLRCRYPLPATEDLGVCPECGDPFTQDDNLMAWRARYPWLRL